MSETEGMTLTEFLLARIAEDEAVARAAQLRYQHVLGIPHYFTANSDTSVAMTPRVALAECEAMRRIVELHPEPGNREDGHHRTVMDHWCWESGDPGPGCETTRALASVYADHPDYREEWAL